ncbi:MAG: potassium channel protein [Deltaproteobacteria bacterium]|nr:potassium channel protein [Deltaproteobacteria bacterium]
MTPYKNIATAGASSRTAKIFRSLILLCFVILIGTSGYMIIEKWGFTDAFYMTIITITTVGFGEIHQVSEIGRLFTVILIFMGMGIIAYTLGIVAQAMVELQVMSIVGRKKLGLKIKSIKDHYIICGYGRIGRIIARELKLQGIPILVIDNNPDSQQELEHNEIAYFINDATNEDVLIEGGVERAKGLVAVVSSDSDNLFITMTARGISPALFILARADEERTQKKLVRAGANRVVMPYLIGGRKMAHTIVKPAVTDFLELSAYDKNVDLMLEELPVRDNSELKGVSLVDSQIRKELDVIIVAIRKKEGTMTFNPSAGTIIETGDTLIALGQSKDIKKLHSLLGR